MFSEACSRFWNASPDCEVVADVCGVLSSGAVVRLSLCALSADTVKVRAGVAEIVVLRVAGLMARRARIADICPLVSILHQTDCCGGVLTLRSLTIVIWLSEKAIRNVGVGERYEDDGMVTLRCAREEVRLQWSLDPRNNVIVTSHVIPSVEQALGPTAAPP